jgi:hypothetical protein
MIFTASGNIKIPIRRKNIYNMDRQSYIIELYDKNETISPKTAKINTGIGNFLPVINWC